ncbi:hypothetical protein D9V28_07210 [Mycetocola zhadangensis]|uniref:Uncharacterized protein n=2 Tax=Mycetocola zhadangensis TaxID=1164595 RepID=A0A3L7J0Q1_9MICO|nr:hypothetical protein D9V28_07210 [Mycetocola zhadangensis]
MTIIGAVAAWSIANASVELVLNSDPASLSLGPLIWGSALIAFAVAVSRAFPGFFMPATRRRWPLDLLCIIIGAGVGSIGVLVNNVSPWVLAAAAFAGVGLIVQDVMTPDQPTGPAAVAEFGDDTELVASA